MSEHVQIYENQDMCIKYLEGGHIKREVINKHLEKFVVEEKAVFIGEICPWTTQWLSSDPPRSASTGTIYTNYFQKEGFWRKTQPH